MGGSAAITHAAVPADRPPTPDPSPPLCGGRGEDKCADPREMESALETDIVSVAGDVRQVPISEVTAFVRSLPKCGAHPMSGLSPLACEHRR